MALWERLEKGNTELHTRETQENAADQAAHIPSLTL